MSDSLKKETRPGIGVDAAGSGVIDPTQNVLDLTEAANKRQDDLRAANNEWIKAEIAHLKEIGQLRADHARDMAAAETRRLDAIRQVDVLAVNTAAERSAAAINALASTTATNAENLRNALNATATTIATQLANTVSTITERIAALEKSSYEGKGKSTVTDPVVEALIAKVDRLGDKESTRTGFDAGKLAVAGGVGLVGGGGLIGLAALAIRLMGH